MNERVSRRTELNLTQGVAAGSAGVSLATWRRWEEDPESVSAKTRTACERVLAAGTEHSRALAASAASFEAAWGDCPYLTPRQAWAVAAELVWWADAEIGEWLRDPDEPLYQISPFDEFDLRVMMLVGESRAWAEAVARRCRAVAAEIERGVLPFDRPGPLIDEILIAAALGGAQAKLDDMPELFELISPRNRADGEYGDWVLDDQWDLVSDAFDDRCRWDEWEVPLHNGHPLLPAVLAERHPFRWFDHVEASGPGYLQRLSGIVRDD